jgi:hypothetical protein
MDMFADTLTGTPWPAVGVGQLRLWDSHANWTYLNPAKGVFDWTTLDAWLDLAATHQVDVLYTFGVTPAWAASNPTQPCPYHAGACSPPANLADWDAFVRALVIHSNGRIRYWELWNEPNLTEYWTGNVQLLSQMAQRAYAIIKSIDPNAVILTPAATAVHGDIGGWLTQYFSAGGGSSADVVAFHGYLPGSAPAPEQLKGVVASINAAMAASGQSDKPIWDTEASWGTAVQLPDLDAQTAFLARSYILHWSFGVQRFYWYAWNSPLWGSLWSTTSAQILKPGIAYGEVYKWMVGATLASPCTAAGDQTWTCQVSRPGGYRAEIVWNAATGSGSSQPFTVDSQFSQYRDLDGKITPISGTTVPVGAKPILLEPFTGISLSPTVLQFDAVTPGIQAPAKSVIVTNIGTSPLLIAGVTATGDYSVANNCGDFLDVGSSCQLLVNFVPTAAGARSGTLLLYDNAPGSPHSAILTNNAVQGAAVFSPSSLAFSSQIVGAAAVTKQLTLTNAGSQALIISGPSLSPLIGTNFSIAGTTCTSTLGPGASCTVSVQFAPTTTGSQTAAVQSINGADGKAVSNAPLSGTGWDFGLKRGNGTPPVALNKSATYDVNVTPLGGFAGTVAVSVTCNLSGVSNCSVTPSSIAMDGSSDGVVHIRINSSASARLGLSVSTMVFALFIMVIFLPSERLAAVLCIAVFIVGCSAATGTSTQAPSVAPGITVTAASQGGVRSLTLPVDGQ